MSQVARTAAPFLASREAEADREPRGGWTPARDAILRKCAADGLSAGGAADKLRVTRNKAIGRAWRLGIKFGGRFSPGASRMTRSFRECVVGSARRLNNCAEAAREWGVHPRTVQAWVAEASPNVGEGA